MHKSTNKFSYLNIFIFSFVVSNFIALNSQSQAYEITYNNTTPQTLTNSICATHNNDTKGIFVSGDSASEGVRLPAEDGEMSTIRSELSADKRFKKTVTGSFVPKNSNDTLRISGKNVKRVSCIFGMLTATNDAFVAINNLKLPNKVGKSRKFTAIAYDAGTEVNTESCAHVPGNPCDAHFVGVAENSVITRHPGLQGIADLNVSTLGWQEPSVNGTVRRIR